MWQLFHLPDQESMICSITKAASALARAEGQCSGCGQGPREGFPRWSGSSSPYQGMRLHVFSSQFLKTPGNLTIYFSPSKGAGKPQPQCGG